MHVVWLAQDVMGWEEIGTRYQDVTLDRLGSMVWVGTLYSVVKSNMKWNKLGWERMARGLGY